MNSLLAPIVGAWFSLALIGAIAVMSDGTPAINDAFWWITAASSAVFGAVIGRLIVKQAQGPLM